MKSSNVREPYGDKRERYSDIWTSFILFFFPVWSLNLIIQYSCWCLWGIGLPLRESNLFKVTSVLNFILFSFIILIWENKELKTDITYIRITTASSFGCMYKRIFTSSRSVDVRLLVCNSVWTCRYTPKFHMEILPPSAGMISTNKSTRFYSAEDQQRHLSCLKNVVSCNHPRGCVCKTVGVLRWCRWRC